MPTGVYERRKGTRRKFSETMKKLYAEGKIVNPMLGKHHSEETKEKMRLKHLGKHPTEETERKISKSLMGHKFSEESKKKMSEIRKRLFAEGKIIHPMTGKHLSEEHKRKLRETHKGRPSPMKGKHIWADKPHPKGMLGKHHSEEAKKKISLSQKGKFVSEETKRKLKANPNTLRTEFKKGFTPWNKGKKGLQVGNNRGKKLSKETKRKLSESKIKYFQEHPDACERMSERQKEYLKSHPEAIARQRDKMIIFYQNHPERKDKMRLVRLKVIIPRKDTSIEIAIQNRLAELGIKFRKHQPITGQPDIFIEPNVCIFADGCYWHSCEQCFDRNKFNSNQRLQIIKDQMITQKLTNDGYIVLRFWEHEINKNLENVVNKIQSSIMAKPTTELQQKLC